MHFASKVVNFLIALNALVLDPNLESIIDEWRLKYLESDPISIDIEIISDDQFIDIDNMNEEERIIRSIKVASKYSMINMDKDHLLTLIDLSYQYEIDPDLALAIIYAESGFNPNAKNKYSSATGYGQLIKSTACSIAKDIPEIDSYNHNEDAYNPYINLHITIHYINNCLNASGGNVKKALKMYRGVEDPPYFNKVLNFRNDIKKNKMRKGLI